MIRLYAIAEMVGDSIYEAHTIGYVYEKREWAETQMSILKNQSEAEGLPVKYKIREFFLVSSPPPK